MIDRSLGEQRSQHKPALIVELVGPACAGKTTLMRTIVHYGPGIKVAPDISVRRPDHLAIFVRHAKVVLPVLLSGSQHGRWCSWEDVKSMVYLSGWARIIGRLAAERPKAVLLDQGPVFRLALLYAFGSWEMRKPAAATWWNELVAHWASLLDLVVWLDAPNAVLEERINSRDRWHLVKGKSEQEASQFLDRYRAAYQYILTKLSAHGGPRIIRFDTSQAPISQIATAVVAACKLEPNGA